MRFLMIDKICSLSPGQYARGIKNVSYNGDFLNELFPGHIICSPVIICEAIAQLVSWILVQEKNFTAKPVITVVDTYESTGHARPGDSLLVEGELEDISEEGALAHGTISLNGKTIAAVNHAVCYLYPLSELNPPDEVRVQFGNLYCEGHPEPSPQSAAPIMRERIPISPYVQYDTIEHADGDTVRGTKNVTATADYFNDHFPRKPILPGVMMLDSMIGLAAAGAKRALQEQQLNDKKPVLRRTRKVKFRRFVQPGDQLIMEAARRSFDPDGSAYTVTATVNGKKAASLSIEFLHLDNAAYVDHYL